MKDEYLEIFDEHNQSLNRQLLRREVHERGFWHRTAQVYVLNYRKELLCNLRSLQKDLFPMLWDVSIGGHLEPSESYQICALRELREELGILPEPKNLIFIATTKIDGQDRINQLLDREHAGIFLYLTNLELPDFNFQKEEILALRYFTLESVKASLNAFEPEIQLIPLQDHYLANIAVIEQTLKNQ